MKPAAAVYVKEPLAFSASVPLAGPLTNMALRLPPALLESFPSTPGAATFRTLPATAV